MLIDVCLENLYDSDNSLSKGVTMARENEVLNNNSMDELVQEIEELANSVGMKFKINQSKVEKFRETLKAS